MGRCLLILFFVLPVILRFEALFCVLRLDGVGDQRFSSSRQLVEEPGELVVVRADFLPVSGGLVLLLLLRWLLSRLPCSGLQVAIASLGRHQERVLGLILLGSVLRVPELQPALI